MGPETDGVADVPRDGPAGHVQAPDLAEIGGRAGGAALD